MPLSETQKRMMQYEAGIDVGMSPQESGMGTFPEITPPMAAKQFEGIPFVTAVPATSVDNKLASREMSMGDMAARYSKDYGVSKPEAYNIIDEVFQGLPDSALPVDYNRLDVALGSKRSTAAEAVAAGTREQGQTMRDLEFVGTSLGAVFGGMQQAYFGLLVGERVDNALARLWPDADIRDDEGELQSKAVVPMVVKGLFVGYAGTALDIMTWGGNFGLADKMKDEAREVAEELAATDYRDNMLTGNEVLEYWANGNGLLSNRLPAVGSPERAQYDAAVRENAANNYAAISDKRWGTIALAGIASTGATFDIFADPGILASEIPVKAFQVLRAGALTSSRARVSGAIADKTRRVSDLTRAVNEAEQWVDEAAVMLKNKPTKANKARLDHAEHHLVKQVSRSNVAANPGETVLLRTSPRIHPDHIEPVGGVFLTAPKEVRTALTRRHLSEQVKRSHRMVRKLEKRLERAKGEATQGDLFPPEELGLDANAIAGDLKAARGVAKQWVESRKWFQKRMAASRGNRTEAFFKQARSNQKPYQAAKLTVEPSDDIQPVLRSIQKNIERGIAQGAPEKEILQWERTYSQILEGHESGLRTGGTEIVRSNMSTKGIVEEALYAQRRRALTDNEFPIKDYNNVGTVQAEQRMAFGPDQTERTSEAARILAAGGEIDDITYHGTSVEMYNSSYGERLRAHSGTETRSVKASSQLELAGESDWLGVDPVNTTVDAAQWQQTMGEKMSDLWSRALHPRSWNLRPAGVVQNMREPMRVMQSVNPRLYTRVHNAVHAQEFELIRMNEVFSRELKLLGVYQDVKGSLVPNKAASERFYRIMNMDPTTDDFSKALQVLSETERRSVRRIRQELDFVSDKLGLRGTDRYIEGYVDHVFDARWFDNGAIPPEFQGLDAAGQVFNPYMIERTGARGYVEDLGMALDYYTRAASRKLHMEPLFEDMKESGRLHMLRNPGDQWFAGYLDDMINNFKGKPSTLGQWADKHVGALNARMQARASVTGAAKIAGAAGEQVGAGVAAAGEQIARLPGKAGQLGGAITAEGVRIGEHGSQMALNGIPNYVSGDASRTALGVTALTYSSVLGGSGRYFPMAVATGLATTGSRFGIFGSLRGILTMATPDGRALAKTAGLDKQWVQIMEEAAWTKMGKLAANMPSFNGVTVVGPSITATENMIRGWTFHAAIGDIIRKRGFSSWDDMVEAGLGNSVLSESLRITEEVNHLFGQLGKPPMFGRFSKSGAAASTQFLSFIPKQSEELLAQAMSNPGRIGQYMMISGYLQRTAAKAGLDISEYVGGGFLPNTPDDATSIATETVHTFLDMNSEMGKLAAGQGDQAAAQIAAKTFMRNLQNFVPVAMATHRLINATETLRTGKLFSNGDLVREVDLGEFEWNPADSYMKNIMNLPSGFMSKTGDPADPTELMSILTQLNSVEGTLERRQFMAMRESADRRSAQRMNISDRMTEARRTGNTEGFSRALTEALETGMLPPDITSMVKRAGMEATVPRLMRMQLKSEQNMLDSINTMMRENALYQMRFGR